MHPWRAAGVGHAPEYFGYTLLPPRLGVQLRCFTVRRRERKSSQGMRLQQLFEAAAHLLPWREAGAGGRAAPERCHLCPQRRRSYGGAPRRRNRGGGSRVANGIAADALGAVNMTQRYIIKAVEGRHVHVVQSADGGNLAVGAFREVTGGGGKQVCQQYFMVVR